MKSQWLAAWNYSLRAMNKTRQTWRAQLFRSRLCTACSSILARGQATAPERHPVLTMVPWMNQNYLMWVWRINAPITLKEINRPERNPNGQWYLSMSCAAGLVGIVWHLNGWWGPSHRQIFKCFARVDFAEQVAPLPWVVQLSFELARATVIWLT